MDVRHGRTWLSGSKFPFCGFKEIIASYLTVQLELVSNEDLSVNGTGEIASGGGANRTMQA